MATNNALNNSSAPFTVSSGNMTVTSGDVVATAGNLTITASGNVKVPATTASTAGVYTIGGTSFMHAYGANSDKNAFVGQSAGNFTLTSGSATNNTGVGYNTLNAVSTGANNTAIGTAAGAANTTASNSVYIGNSAGTANTIQANITAVGSFALSSLNDTTAAQSGQNTAIGLNSLRVMVGGQYNTAVGYDAGRSVVGNTTGTGSSFNVLIGALAGNNYTTTESSNIIIAGSNSNTGTVGESNVTRIGTGTGTGIGQQNKCFISGVYNITPGATQQIVIVDSTDQHGSIPYVTKTSFTASLNFGGSTTGITYTTQSSWYMRVGNVVYVQIDLVLSSKGAQTGAATITGLPVTSDSTVPAQLTLALQNTTFTSEPIAVINTSGTTITLTTQVTASTYSALSNTAFTNTSTMNINGFYFV